MSKKRIGLIVLFSCIFIILVILNYLNKLSIIDENIYDKIISFKSSQLTSFFRNVTTFGGLLAVILISDIILIFDKKKGLYFIANVIIIIFLNTIFKNIFMRERPLGINLIVESGYSFPSGHSMISVGSYGLLIVYLLNLKLNKYIKIGLMFILLLLILLILISRIYLGVHFFSDILAGTCLSVVWLLLYTYYLKIRKVINL